MKLIFYFAKNKNNMGNSGQPNRYYATINRVSVNKIFAYYE